MMAPPKPVSPRVKLLEKEAMTRMRTSEFQENNEEWFNKDVMVVDMMVMMGMEGYGVVVRYGREPPAEIDIRILQ